MKGYKYYDTTSLKTQVQGAIDAALMLWSCIVIFTVYSESLTLQSLQRQQNVQ